MAYKSGKNARVILGASTPVYCKSWSIDESCEKIDVTSGENAGIGYYVPGVKDIEFTIEFNHNYGGSQFVQLPVGSAPTVTLNFCQDGATLGTTNNMTIAANCALILTNSCKADVRGAITGTITGILTAGLAGVEASVWTDFAA